MRRNIVYLLIFALLTSREQCFALPDITSTIKLNLVIKKDTEAIDLIGLIQSQNHVQQILSILQGSDYTLKPTDEDFRYPYDFTYSDTTASWNVTVPTASFGSAVKDLAWFSDGSKLVVVGTPNAAGTVGRIYSLSETGSALYGNATHVNDGGRYTFTWAGNNTVYTVTAASVRPINNKYIVIGGVRNPSNITHRLIYFDEELTSTFILADYDHGSTVRSIEWSPDGKYLAIAGDVSNSVNLRIYRFENASLHNLSRSEYFWDNTNPIYSIKWHPSSKYLAVAGGISNSNHTVKVLHFNKESLSELVGCRTNNGMSSGHVPEISWSPDGKRLAVAHYSTSAEPKVYEFKNNLQLKQYSTGSTAAEVFHSVSYSPDGAYISFARPTQVDTYTSYENGTNLSTISGLNYVTSTIRKVAWEPGGNFCAVAIDTGTVSLLKIDENPHHLAKRIQNELFAMYESATHMSHVTSNIIKPLAIANSNSLVTYHQKNPESYTATFTENMSSVASHVITGVDVSEDKQFVAVCGNAEPFIRMYAIQGDLLIPRPYTQLNGTETFNCVAISPNNRYVAAGSVSSGITRVFQFNEHHLQAFTSTATGARNVKWFNDSKSLLINDGVYELRRSSIPAIHAQTFTAGDLDSTRQYIASISSSNILNIERLGTSYTTLVTVTSLPISNLSSIGAVAWGNPHTIFVANTASGGNQFAACYFNGTSLTLIGTGVTTAQINNIAINDQGTYASIVLNADDSVNPNILEYKLTPTTSPIIQIGSIDHGGGSVYPYSIKYTPESDYLVIGNRSISGTTEDLTMYKRVYEPFPYAIAGSYTILIGTSNATSGGESGGGNTLNIATSDAIVTYQSLVQANSDVIVSRSPLIIANSNAIAGLLVDTSNSINNFVIPNSQVIVSQEELIAANSNVVVTVDPLIKATSQVIVTYQPLALANSNAVSGLLIDTSNAIAGLLVETSNATDGLLIDTSNTIVTNAIKLTPLDTIDTGPAHIHFNSPTITMSYDVFISSDHQLNIHQSGVINGNGHSISFPSGSATVFFVDAAVTTTLENIILKNFNDSTVSLGAGSSLIFGNNCRVEISEAQSLSRPWFFAGSALLDAHNNQLTLNQADEYIAAREEALLTIANTSLKNVGLNNIRCINDNASITFKNVSCHLTSDLTFSTGAISVVNDLKITGTRTFNFTTTKPLTINAASRLILDQSTSFNYAPASNNRTLLTLTDSTAQLVFKNATLLATATGPRLTKGTLIVNGNMNVQSSAASPAEAVVLGNGTPENDLIINLMPVSGIKLLSGYLNYENAN